MTHSRHMLATALALLVACQRFDATVTLGEVVPNVLQVNFDSAREGQPRVVLVDRNSVQPDWPFGRSGTEHSYTFFGAPSGMVTLRPELLRANGRVAKGAEIEFEVPPLPEDLPTVSVFSSNPAKAEVRKGWVVFNAFSKKGGWFLAVDGSGRIVWWQRVEKGDKPIRIRPSRDGQSLLYGSIDRGNSDTIDEGQITRWDLPNGETTVTRAVELHHDFVELPSGDLAWLSFDREDRLIEDIEVIAPILADAIRVAPQGAVEGEESVLFSLMDLDEPLTVVCDHMPPGGNTGAYWDWSHGNSLVWDEDTQSLRMLARFWESVLEVGLDGSLHWQAGGLNSDWNLQGWFNHGHTSELTGDDWWVFSNNNHLAKPAITEFVHLKVDTSNGVATEIARIPDPYGRFAAYLGDIRRLPNGHILVAFSPFAHLMELDQNGELVWELTLNGATDIGRISFVPQLGG